VNVVESNGIQWNPIPFLGIGIENSKISGIGTESGLKIQNFSITSAKA
jgi:hypothetical protein